MAVWDLFDTNQHYRNDDLDQTPDTGEIVDMGTDDFERDLAQTLLKSEEIEPKYVKVEV